MFCLPKTAWPPTYCLDWKRFFDTARNRVSQPGPIGSARSNGGVTASTEAIAAKRHTGVRAPVIVRKTITANQQMAYAA